VWWWQRLRLKEGYRPPPDLCTHTSLIQFLTPSIFECILVSNVRMEHFKSCTKEACEIKATNYWIWTLAKPSNLWVEFTLFAAPKDDYDDSFLEITIANISENYNCQHFWKL
jgi:hypothetical protein